MNINLLCLKAKCRASFSLALAGLLFLLPSVCSAVAPPNWTINPADFQFRMDMVIRINYDGLPSNDPGNIVGVFVGPELRGVATPIDIGGQKYFFTTIYSNQYTGETLRFRAYYAPDDQVYSTNDSITFTNYAFVGNIANPYWINIDPNYDFPPEILPIPKDTTLQNLPFDRIALNDYLLSLDGDPVIWSATAGANLSVSITNDTMTVQPVSSSWTGTDTVCVIVKEDTPGMLADTACTCFTVLPDYGPPVWQNIPSQTIFGGGSFATFDLDNYLTYNGPCREFALIFPSPYTSMNAPIVPVIAPDGTVTIQIIDPMWRGALDFGFIVWDCDYPDQRRDTTFATFSVIDDNNPHFTSPPTVNYQENACNELYDAQATDPNDSEGSGLTYSIVGGADQGKFSINPANGKLSWNMFTPDFENPGDANMNNQYEVTIRVTNTLTLFAELNLVVTVTDENPEPFNPQISGSSGSCIAGGTALLTASGGASYLWSTNATTASITVTNSGTYSVTITSSGGCTAVRSATLNTAPTITASGNTGIVCIGVPIMLSSTPMGGSGVYTMFAWEGPNSYTSNAQNPASLLATIPATGTYTVTVTDNAGCTATATTSITVSTNPAPTITASNNGPFCVGQNIALGSTPAGGSGTYTTYKWAGPNSFTSLLRNPIAFPATLAAAGTYTVTVTDNQGCTATGTTVVVVNANPAIGATGNGPLCVGANVTLGSNAIGGSGVYSSYSWAGPNMYSASVQNPTPFPATLAGSGTYTVTVTDNRGCSATNTVSVLITGKPSITATAVGPTCLGSNITLASTPSGGSGTYTTFVWTGPDSYSANVEDPAPFPGISAATGTYTVTVTDNANCSATASTTITVHTVPTITAGSNTPVCQGANLVLNSTPAGGTAPYILYKWAGPDNYVASTEDPVGFSTTLASAGTYTVTVTDNNGCTGTGTTVVNIVPKPTAVATSNSPACIGTIVSLKVTPSGGTGTYTGFSWTGPAPFTSNVQNPPGFPAVLASAGTYRVTVTDNAGCTATASTTLAVQNNPSPNITAGSNSPVCPGGTINLTSSPSGGNPPYNNYAWSGPNGYTGSGQNPVGFPASVAASGVYTVTVTDNSNCKNTASATVVVDPPTISASNSGNCTDPNITLTSTPAGGSGTYTTFSWQGPNFFTSGMQNPTPFPRTMAAQGTYTVTVTDNNGCTGTGTTYVQVGDIVPPTITCPGDKTLNVNTNCQATLADWTGEATNLSDDCTPSGSITVTQSPLPSTIVSGHTTVQTVTLTADDGNMNTTPCTFDVTLKDVSKPLIQCPADQTISADVNCNGTVGSWTLVSKMDNCTTPSASIMESQNVASGTVLNGHNGSTTVTLTADDGNGNTESCSFTVTLKDITPPVIQCPANQTVSADANCQGLVGTRVLVSKMDNCTPSASIMEMQNPAPSTVMIGHNDSRTVTLTATDGAGNTADCQFTVTLKDVTPPTITCPNPTTVTCASDYPAPNTNLVTATDNCSVPVKTHVNDSAPYDVQCLNRFKRTRTYRATDAVGNSSTCTQVITVFDGTAPVFTFVPANVTVQCNSIPAVGNPTATDNCAGTVTITYNGQTRVDGTCLDRYTLTRQWTASDICGNTRTATQRINVIDSQLPNFTSAPANVTVQCDAIPAVATPTATDNCDASVLITYNGQTKTNGTCLNNYTLTRRWTATDNCSNTRSVSQRIVVVDNGKPVFTSFPADQTIQCVDPIPGVGAPTATDACEGTVTVTYLGQTSANTLCPGLYQLKRTWRATDACGNSTASTQTITVADTQAPVFVSVPPNSTINCEQSLPPLENPVASDACGGYVQITFLGQVRTDGNCLYNYTITRTWRADDLCGNTALATQVFTVQDVTAPVFNSGPADVTVTCANIPAVPSPVNASDNCGTPTVTYLGEVQSSGDCVSGYTLQRTWQATDQCGNIKVHTQTITVQGSNFGPKTPPGITGRPNNTINLQPNPTTDRVSIGLSDFAGETVTVSIVSDLGQLVWEKFIPVVEDLSVSVRLREAGASPGIYTVSVRGTSGTISRRLVLIE